jgi:hypothetical protein
VGGPAPAQELGDGRQGELRQQLRLQPLEAGRQPRKAHPLEPRVAEPQRGPQQGQRPRRAYRLAVHGAGRAAARRPSTGALSVRVGPAAAALPAIAGPGRSARLASQPYPRRPRRAWGDGEQAHEPAEARLVEPAGGVARAQEGRHRRGVHRRRHWLRGAQHVLKRRQRQVVECARWGEGERAGGLLLRVCAGLVQA